MAGNVNSLADVILKIWNPTGKALAAEYWISKTPDANGKFEDGFSPVCANKFKNGCLLGKAKKACSFCDSKNHLPLTTNILNAQMAGKTRSGIYPLLQGDLTAWVASDLDNHNGEKDPAKDLKSLIQVCSALDVPLFSWNSNSGKGFHPYIFFEKPIRVIKARSLMLALIDRAGIDISHRKEEDGSFDCIFPKQDSLRNGSIGNLIALPWYGEAVKKRKSTLLLDPQTLEPFGQSLKENIETFLEYHRALTEKEVDAILDEMGVLPHRATSSPLARKKSEPLEQLIEKCSFLKHCRDDAANLPEDHWYAMVAVLAHQFGGPALIHELSKPYTKNAGYSYQETQDKIVHILNDQAGPVTCQYLKTLRDCQSDCGVKCPIHLLNARRQEQDSKDQPETEFTSEELYKAALSEQDGDASIFIKLNRNRFNYDHSSGTWFERNGHYYIEDVIGEALAAIDGVTELYEKEAARFFWLQMKAAKEQDEKAGQDAEKHLKVFRRKISLLQKIQWKQAVLQLAAAGRHSLGITGNEWDRDPWILPCINGIWDLKTGEFRGGQTDEFIKTVCPTESKGIDEPAPRWESFLTSVFDDEDLPGFVQRLFGSALIGTVIEHVLPILTGPGRNGKGTMLETLKSVLGSLAGPIPSELLLRQHKSKDPDAPSASLMALKGKRLTWASEIERGRHFSTARTKWLVGGDTVTGRDPFGRRQVEFSPTHSIFLLTNDKPRADASDFAFWSRVLLIPFRFTFVDDPHGPYERKRDPHLLEKLKAEAPGILSWLVRGCLLWQKVGLNPPETVHSSTEEYRQGEDQFARFLEDCCSIDKQEEAKAGDLFKAYRAWCDEFGERAASGRTFGEEMGKKFDSYRKRDGYHYIGLGLRAGGEV